MRMILTYNNIINENDNQCQLIINNINNIKD